MRDKDERGKAHRESNCRISHVSENITFALIKPRGSIRIACAAIRSNPIALFLFPPPPPPPPQFRINQSQRDANTIRPLISHGKFIYGSPPPSVAKSSSSLSTVPNDSPRLRVSHCSPFYLSRAQAMKPSRRRRDAAAFSYEVMLLLLLLLQHPKRLLPPPTSSVFQRV